MQKEATGGTILDCNTTSARLMPLAWLTTRMISIYDFFTCRDCKIMPH
jgi:hypothetical protein